MNCQAIQSLLDSENWHDNELEILLMESSENCWDYPFCAVKVIYPTKDNIKFNFHKYFNIGLSETSGEFIAFCNNDIIFKNGWFSAIKEVADKNKRFLCFSPIDDSGAYPKMSETSLPRDKEYYKGWQHQKHFAPWCFVWKRKVFDIIGPFDETFDFYAADADELNILSKYAIFSIVCTKSIVNHLAGQTAIIKQTEVNPTNYRITDFEKYPLTAFEISQGYDKWLYDDYRFYDGYQKEKKKWGTVNTTKWIQRKIEKYPILNFRPLSTILLSKPMNKFFNLLRGIDD